MPSELRIRSPHAVPKTWLLHSFSLSQCPYGLLSQSTADVLCSLSITATVPQKYSRSGKTFPKIVNSVYFLYSYLILQKALFSSQNQGFFKCINNAFLPFDSVFFTSTLKRPKKKTCLQSAPTPVLKNAGVDIHRNNQCGLLHNSQVFRLPLENRRS